MLASMTIRLDHDVDFLEACSMFDPDLDIKALNKPHFAKFLQNIDSALHTSVWEDHDRTAVYGDVWKWFLLDDSSSKLLPGENICQYYIRMSETLPAWSR